MRELKRLKRDREQREKEEQERLEIEKIHAMTDEERQKYFELNPKVGLMLGLLKVGFLIVFLI